MADGLPPPDGLAADPGTEPAGNGSQADVSSTAGSVASSDVSAAGSTTTAGSAEAQDISPHDTKPTSIGQLLAHGAVLSTHQGFVLQNQYGLQVALLQPLTRELQQQVQQYQTTAMSGSATVSAGSGSCIVTTNGALAATQPLVLAPLPPAAHFFMPNVSSPQNFLTLAQPQSQSVLHLNTTAMTPTVQQHASGVLTNGNSTAHGVLSPQQQTAGNINHFVLAGCAPSAGTAGAQSLHQPSFEEVPDLEELERFAKHFKRRRIELGFTQGDVGTAMGKIYNNDFSQTTISRFEALNLSFKNMCKLKPMLEKWLQEVDTPDCSSAEASQQQQQQQTAEASEVIVSMPATHVPLASEAAKHAQRRRKKRTSIENNTKCTLERNFLNNQKPSSEEIALIAENLGMDREVVRVWFCNRRQKQKRINPSPPPSNTFALSSAPQPVVQCFTSAGAASAAIAMAHGMGQMTVGPLNTIHHNILPGGQAQELFCDTALAQHSGLLRMVPCTTSTDDRQTQQPLIASVHLLKEELCSSSPALPAIASMAALATSCFRDLQSSSQQQQQDVVQQASAKDSSVPNSQTTTGQPSVTLVST